MIKKNKTYYSITDVAKLLNYSRQYIWELISKNKIEGAVKLGDSKIASWMIPGKWVNDRLKKQK